MKKLTSLLVVAVLAMVLAPVAAVADTSINTELVRDIGGGAAPIVKAKWEMVGKYTETVGNPSLEGKDDSTAAGAQIAPTGAYDTYKDYSICAIVTDPDGIADIDNVYTDIYYPSTHSFHANPAHLDVTNGGMPNNPADIGLAQCGAQRGDENVLSKLTKTQGYNLFCNSIRNNNNNLPTFYANTLPGGSGQFDYNEICDPDGELMKETAFVYCAEKQLYYEDPAGMYDVLVFALDKAGVFSNEAWNQFEYLPLTSFAVDFTSVNYGNVKLNTHKVISGDLNFSNGDGKPTVRNLGNTRLEIGIVQNDMGMGTTDGKYNVKYDARVGSNEDDWKDFWPYKKIYLQDILDLSEDEEMDFSILVTKFPNQNSTWVGTMTLDAKQSSFRDCPPCPTGGGC